MKKKTKKKTKRHAAKRTHNPKKRTAHQAAPKKRHTKKRSAARRSNPSPLKRRSSRKGFRRHRNPSIGKEAIAVAAGLAAGVVVVLASALLAPTNQNAAYGITAVGVAAGIGLAIAVDPIIGTAVAVGAAAPTLVQKGAAEVYKLIAGGPSEPAPGADAGRHMGAGRNPYGMGAGRNPFGGMRAVVTSGSRNAAAQILGLGALATAGSRAAAAQSLGLGAARNPFGMGYPIPFGASDTFSG